jgi:hypothetical protein
MIIEIFSFFFCRMSLNKYFNTNKGYDSLSYKNQYNTLYLNKNIIKVLITFFIISRIVRLKIHMSTTDIITIQ